MRQWLIGISGKGEARADSLRFAWKRWKNGAHCSSSCNFYIDVKLFGIGRYPHRRPESCDSRLRSSRVRVSPARRTESCIRACARGRLVPKKELRADLSDGEAPARGRRLFSTRGRTTAARLRFPFVRGHVSSRANRRSCRYLGYHVLTRLTEIITHYERLASEHRDLASPIAARFSDWLPVTRK